MAGKLQFVVEVQADQAGRALQAVQHNLEEFGKAAKVSFLPARDGARGAGKEMNGLAGAMMAFKREQVQQGRMVGFYVRELTEFTGMSKEAAGVASGLGSVLAELASGFTKGAMLAAGFEAVKLAIGLVNDELERNKRQIEAVNDAWQGVNAVWRTSRDMMRDISQTESAAEAAGRKYSEAVLPEITKRQEELNKALEDGAGWWREWFFEDRSGVFDSYKAAIEARTKALREMKLEAEGGRTAIMYAASGSPYSDAGLAGKAPTNTAYSGLLWRDQSKAAGTALRDIANEKPKQDRFAGPDAPVFNPWNPWAESPTWDKAWQDMGKNTYVHGGDNEGGWLDQANQSFNKGAAKDQRAEADEQAKKMREMAEAGAAINDIFSNMGAAFGKSAGAMGAQLGKLIQQAIQLGIAMSASAGPFGWLQVAAAAAAIMATVASVPEFRAAGGSVAAGRPYVVGELGPELFVPGQSGSIVPNNRMGGGLTINITTPDAKSFRAMLESNASPLIDAIQTWQRDRRL